MWILIPNKEKFPFPKKDKKLVLHYYKSPKSLINQGMDNSS